MWRSYGRNPEKVSLNRNINLPSLTSLAETHALITATFQSEMYGWCVLDSYFAGVISGEYYSLRTSTSLISDLDETASSGGFDHGR